MLTENSTTIASHSLIILCAALAVTRLLAKGYQGRDMLITSVCWFFAAFVIERAYYLVARVLKPSGINLWEAHPAPEFLSGLVASSLLAVAYALSIDTLRTLEAKRRRLCIDAGWGACLWMLIALMAG